MPPAFETPEALSEQSRKRLAEAQTRLVAALVAPENHDADQAGFAASDLVDTAASLRRKRAREVERTWPAVVRSLGAHYRERFERFAHATPPPSHGGPLADGRAFVHELAALGELDDLNGDARLEVFWCDLRFVSGREGLTPRRSTTMRTTWHPRTRCHYVAVWIPWLRRCGAEPLRWFCLRVPGSRCSE